MEACRPRRSAPTDFPNDVSQRDLPVASIVEQLSTHQHHEREKHSETTTMITASNTTTHVAKTTNSTKCAKTDTPSAHHLKQTCLPNSTTITTQCKRNQMTSDSCINLTQCLFFSNSNRMFPLKNHVRVTFWRCPRQNRQQVNNSASLDRGVATVPPFTELVADTCLASGKFGPRNSTVSSALHPLRTYKSLTGAPQTTHICALASAPETLVRKKNKSKKKTAEQTSHTHFHNTPTALQTRSETSDPRISHFGGHMTVKTKHTSKPGPA